MNKDQRKLLILSSLGGILEFYDFVIFALFASYISNAFFLVKNNFTALLIGFATFAIGYLVRPLGGIFFGHFGDKVGRKSTFSISILLMAFATLGIGLMPTYMAWGATAPVFIVILRIIQGLSIGGEIPGAITYVSEAFPKQKGLACGIIFCFLLSGIVLGSLINALVTSLFSADQMKLFGWRLPFIFGGFLGLTSFVLRKDLHESSQFMAITTIEKYPLLNLCQQQFSSILTGASFVALCAITVTSLFLFIPSYFTEIIQLPHDAYIWQRTLAIAIGAILSVLFGYLSDVMNYKILFLLLCFLTATLAFPIFFIYIYYPSLYPLAFLASALLLGFAAGVIPRLLSELFPTNIRYTGIAVSYNLGFAIFGGLTPFMALSLIYYTNWPTMPALCLIIAAILAIIGATYQWWFAKFKKTASTLSEESLVVKSPLKG